MRQVVPINLELLDDAAQGNPFTVQGDHPVDCGKKGGRTLTSMLDKPLNLLLFLLLRAIAAPSRQLG